MTHKALNFDLFTLCQVTLLACFLQLERQRLRKEQELREQAQTEKEEMERRMKELQDQCEQAHEALVSYDH